MVMDSCKVMNDLVSKTEDGPVENAVWSYEQPMERVAQIKSYLAFYPTRVDRIDETAGT